MVSICRITEATIEHIYTHTYTHIYIIFIYTYIYIHSFLCTCSFHLNIHRLGQNIESSQINRLNLGINRGEGGQLRITLTSMLFYLVGIQGCHYPIHTMGLVNKYLGSLFFLFWDRERANDFLLGRQQSLGICFFFSL